jgi:hypothetical protein
MGGSCHAPSFVVLLRMAELEASEAPINIDQILCRGGLSFRGPNQSFLAVDDKVNASEIDGHSRGPNIVVAGHSELGEAICWSFEPSLTSKFVCACSESRFCA